MLKDKASKLMRNIARDPIPNIGTIALSWNIKAPSRSISAAATTPPPVAAPALAPVQITI
jgi:hypothetical protein